jgi:plasmid stabilization system protein ParE
MIKPAILDRLAQREASKAYRRYVAKANPRTAARFAAELSRSMRLVEERAGSFPAYLAGTRRCILKKFPYLLVFIEYPDHVFVCAVAHAKRRPGYWRRRLH